MADNKKKSFNLPLQLAYKLEEVAKARDRSETDILKYILNEYFQASTREKMDDNVPVNQSQVAQEIQFINILLSDPLAENAVCYRRLRKELDRLCQILKMPSCDG